MRAERVRAAIGIALFGLVLAGCGRADAGGGKASAGPAASPSPAGGTTQTNEEGPVTVAVTWNGPESGPVFRVAMDTHSVDLDGYDLTRLAELRDPDGRAVAPAAWDAPKGGHHREGDLAFPGEFSDGTPVLGPGARALTLVIREVGGVPERRFEWSW